MNHALVQIIVVTSDSKTSFYGVVCCVRFSLIILYGYLNQNIRWFPVDLMFSTKENVHKSNLHIMEIKKKLIYKISALESKNFKSVRVSNLVFPKSHTFRF